MCRARSSGPRCWRASSAPLASTVAMVSAASTIEIGPRVGDILVIRQGARMPPDWAFTVATASAPSVTCSLRPAAMASQGGSIVVEQRLRAQGTFQVHWAGEHTSDAGADCGSDAALVVDGVGPAIANECGRRCWRRAQSLSSPVSLLCEACQPLTKQQAVDPGSALRR